MSVILRSYQSEALEAVRQAYHEGNRAQVVELPVGAGKTVLFASLAASWHQSYANHPPIILAHRDILIDQAADKIRTVWPTARIAIEQGSRREWNGRQDILVASVQTLGRRLNDPRIANTDWGLVVLDEAHHAKARTFRRVLGELGWRANPALISKHKLFLGVTATPDAKTLQTYPHVAYRRSMVDLIQLGYLSALTGVRVQVDVDLDKVAVTKYGDYDEGELSKVLNTRNRNELIVSAYNTLAKKRRALVFAVTVEHARDLAKAFNAAGITAEEISGEMPRDKRNAILKRFERRETQVLVNCALLTEGFDAPFVDCVILARPTLSRTLYVQMVGRAARRYPGKADALIVDLADASKRHSLSLSDVLDLPLEVSPKEKAKRSVFNRSAFAADEADVLMVGRQIKVAHVNLYDVEHASDASAFSWIVAEDIMHCFVGQGTRVSLRPQGNGYIAYWESPSHPPEPIFDTPMDPAWAQGLAEEWLRQSKPDALALAQSRAGWRRQPASDKQLEQLHRFALRDHAIAAHLTKGQVADLLAMCFMRAEQSGTQHYKVIGEDVWLMWQQQFGETTEAV